MKAKVLSPSHNFAAFWLVREKFSVNAIIHDRGRSQRRSHFVRSFVRSSKRSKNDLALFVLLALHWMENTNLAAESLKLRKYKMPRAAIQLYIKAKVHDALQSIVSSAYL